MHHRIAPTGTFQAILLFTTLCFSSVQADFPPTAGLQADSTARWSAVGGETSFRFIPSLLQELEISVSGPPAPPQSGKRTDFRGSVYRSTPLPDSEMPGEFRFSGLGDGSLDIWAPMAAWGGFAGGALRLSGNFSIAWPGGRFETPGLQLRPVAQDVLELTDQHGNPLFRLDSIHSMLYPDERVLALWNMDMSLTPWLAGRMGYPDLAGMVIASAFTRAQLDIPEGAQLQGNCTSPNWHNGTSFLTDVELSSLNIVQEVAREPGGRVAIAPSASLQNVGTADVPWYQKFTTPTGGTYPDPYDRDQHPFLVWAMYRVVDDIPQQIGQSEVKHAFLTINGTCGCSSGHILWSAKSSPVGQGCTDTYGVGNNNNPPDLGLRDEIPALSGAWEQCGSMFAPGASPPGPCDQTVTGSTADPFERRLVVQESELQTADASYYFEGWYVIRDDVDIFNTMAHKSVTPTFGSSWTFPAGAHTLGPAIDEWVPPDTRGANQAHFVGSSTDGHYSLAVKVTDLGKGMYRYVYALMNYDFDKQFKSLSLALPVGVSLANVEFLDGDSTSGNDWTSSTDGGALTFSAPKGAELDWGFMVTFVFEANSPPVEASVHLEAHERPLGLDPVVLGLGPNDQFHRDGFEN